MLQVFLEFLEFQTRCVQVESYVCLYSCVIFFKGSTSKPFCVNHRLYKFTLKCTACVCRKNMTIETTTPLLQSLTITVTVYVIIIQMCSSPSGVKRLLYRERTVFKYSSPGLCSGSSIDYMHCDS